MPPNLEQLQARAAPAVKQRHEQVIVQTLSGFSGVLLPGLAMDGHAKHTTQHTRHARVDSNLPLPAQYPAGVLLQRWRPCTQAVQRSRHQSP